MSRRRKVKNVKKVIDKQKLLETRHQKQVKVAKIGIALGLAFILLTLVFIYIPRSGPDLNIDVNRICITSETYHIHVRLALVQYKGNATWRTYYSPGGVGLPPSTPCIRPLHTHLADGIIHIENDYQRQFTIQQFFEVWHQPFNSTTVADLIYDPTIGPLRFNYQLHAIDYSNTGNASVLPTAGSFVTFDPNQPLYLEDGMNIVVNMPPPPNAPPPPLNPLAQA